MGSNNTQNFNSKIVVQRHPLNNFGCFDWNTVAYVFTLGPTCTTEPGGVAMLLHRLLNQNMHLKEIHNPTSKHLIPGEKEEDGSPSVTQMPMMKARNQDGDEPAQIAQNIIQCEWVLLCIHLYHFGDGIFIANFL